LEALGVDHDVKQYPDAGHSFLNHLPSSGAVAIYFAVMGKLAGRPFGYHEVSAKDARQRIVSFFDRHLKPVG